MLHSLATLGGAPRVTQSREVSPDLKLIFLWLNLERTMEDGSGEETSYKKVITFRGDD